MAYPKEGEIEVPLLRELHKLGGKAKPSELYPLLVSYFPELTKEDLERKTLSNPTIYKWHNLVQWARWHLVNKGQIDRSERGIWKITPAGIARISREEPRKQPIQETPPPELTPVVTTLRELVQQHEQEIRRELASRLSEMKPAEFEMFSKRLLEALGFEEVAVTQVSRDGGIDGYGRLRMGVITVSAAFQCKRWKNVVSRPEIDQFRGAISGQYDQGIFIATSSFTKDATEQSFRPGAVPIVMIDGERIVDLMVQHHIGVQTRPITIMEIDRDFFTFTGDAPTE